MLILLKQLFVITLVHVDPSTITKNELRVLVNITLHDMDVLNERDSLEQGMLDIGNRS